jgi:hypothetical protein
MRRAGLLRSLAFVASLCGVALAIPACQVGVEADYPVAYGDYPDGCIATTEAVYYNGYPSYWCGGFWYFRGEGGRWGHYDREPPGLYQHRAQGGPARRNSEPTSRPAGGGRGGGGAHGGGGGGRR